MINNIGIILASGEGLRYNSKIPKQYVKLNGIPVVYYSLNEFIKSGLFEKIVVVINHNKYRYLFKDYNVKVVLGGKTRNESIYNAIQYCKKFNPENILFHDAVRPLIKAEDLQSHILFLDKYTATVTAEKITDSLYGGNREDFKLIQTPEAFKFDKLIKCFKKEKPTTAIYQQLNGLFLIKLIYLNHPNYKITYPYDLFMMEHLVKYCLYKKRIPNLKNKNILLLGASGGIGSVVLKELKKYSPKTIYAPTSKELNLNQDFLPYILSCCYEDTNIIINCAGIMERDNNILLTSNYDKIMNINLKTNLSIIDYAKTLKNKPINIITISSSSATKGRQNLTNYSASKVALHSIIESQAEELANRGIYLNCICPEKVLTPLLLKHETKPDLREVLNPKEVADAILSYSDTKSYGQIVHIRKGMNLE